MLAIEQVWDLRKNDVVSRMRGHSDTVTGMKLSPDGSYLLTNAMDNTCKWHHGKCIAIVEGACLLETCFFFLILVTAGKKKKNNLNILI